MNSREAAIVSAYTGVLIGDFETLHTYIEEKLGRHVFTHELADKAVVEELKEKTRKDFVSIYITPLLDMGPYTSGGVFHARTGEPKDPIEDGPEFVTPNA